MAELPCDTVGICMMCKTMPSNEHLLLCSRCNSLWHTSCLRIRCESLPDTTQDLWLCPDCEDQPSLADAQTLEGADGIPAMCPNVQRSNDTIARIRAIRANTALTEQDMARQCQDLMMMVSSSNKSISLDAPNAAHRKASMKRKRHSFLEIFDVDLNCTFCLELLDQPVTTPCGHNSCLKCFRRWIGHGRTSCAKCRMSIPPKMARQPQINIVLSLAICKAKSKSLSFYGLSSKISGQRSYSIQMASDELKHEGVQSADALEETKRAQAFSHQCLHSQKDIDDDEMASMFLRANEFQVATVEGDSSLTRECKEDSTRGCINTPTKKMKVQDCVGGNQAFGRQKGLTFLRKILKEFYCIMCKDVLKQPISTPCGHSFCKSCLLPVIWDQINRHHRYGVNGRPLRGLSVGKACPSCQEDITKFLLNAQVNWQMEAVIQHLRCYIAEIGNARFEEVSRSRDEATIKKDGFRHSKDDVLVLAKNSEGNGFVTDCLRKKPIIEENNRDKNSDQPKNTVELKEHTYDVTMSKLLPTFTSEKNRAFHQENSSPATCKQPEDADKNKTRDSVKKGTSFQSSMPSAFYCGLCKQQLESPLSTPCGHYFCKSCLSGQKRYGVYGRSLRTLKVPKRCPCCQADINSYLIHLQALQEVKDVLQPLKCTGNELQEKMEGSTNQNANTAENCQSFRSHESDNYKGKSTFNSMMATVNCQDLKSPNVYKRRKSLNKRTDSSQRGDLSKSAKQTKERLVESQMVATNGISKHGGTCQQRQESKEEHSRWQRLVKDFGCALCKKVLKLPLTTPCGHNFCKPCLLEVFSGQIGKCYSVYGRCLRVQRVLKRCPSCQEDINTYLINPQVNKELLKCMEWLTGDGGDKVEEVAS